MVVQNPNTPTVVLAKLADDENEFVRFYVAESQNTSTETLEKLANDEIEDVRYAAKVALFKRSND